MVSWWIIDSYFNTELIQIGDIDIMISAYGLSGLFGFRVTSKYIGHNNYIGIRSNFRSKPTQINGPVHKSGFDYSYLRINLNRLPQAVAKNSIHCLSHKVRNASKIIDPVINVFSPNYESSHLHICYHAIVTFGIREKFIGLSNNFHDDSLDRLRISVVYKVKSDICILQKSYDSK